MHFWAKVPITGSTILSICDTTVKELDGRRIWFYSVIMGGVLFPYKESLHSIRRIETTFTFTFLFWPLNQNERLEIALEVFLWETKYYAYNSLENFIFDPWN